jgi:transcriptional regulator with XRE-family HTH domain
MKTVEHLLEESGLTIDDLAERAKLDVRRVEAICAGRWMPSPEERRSIAAAFQVPVETVSWGHSMDPRNIRYRRFGFEKH